MKKTKKFPSKQEILEFIKQNSKNSGKREIAKEFSISGDDRIRLKQILRELEEEGFVVKAAKRSLKTQNQLPESSIVEITSVGYEEIIAEPVDWKSEDSKLVVFIDDSNGVPHFPQVGDRFLVKLKKASKNTYQARIIRRIQTLPSKIAGVFRTDERGGYVVPADKKLVGMFRISAKDAKGAKPEDLVVIEPFNSSSKVGAARGAKVVENYGFFLSPKAIPMIAICNHGLAYEFSEEAKAEATNVKPALLKGRVDCRDIPFVTIDGETAKDFDDAVFAEPDSNPNNSGGWHIMIAISDLSWYVRPQTALDKEAKLRGNSVYFAGGVVPMLPKELSNELCSLKPDVDRPCLAVHIFIDEFGVKLSHKFERIMIKSIARLTYQEVQAAIEGEFNDNTKDIFETVISPLFGAYKSLAKARKARGVLEIDMDEKTAIFDGEGNIAAIIPDVRFESNKLIEEFMIAANVCAAEQLEKFDLKTMYRVHDIPSAEKREILYDFLKSIGIAIPKGKTFTAEYYSNIIASAKGKSFETVVKNMVLRCQSQARYSSENIGHFGLALEKYVHFTSPIRRYADLLVHRALVRGLKKGEGGISDEDIKTFDDTANHISIAERRAMAVERETMERFIAVYMSSKVGRIFTATVSGVSPAGLFVTLDDIGAEGLVPMGSLSGGRYEFEQKSQSLIGTKIYRLGDELDVILKESDPITGYLLFNLADFEDIIKTNKKQGKSKLKPKPKVKKRSSKK